MPEKRTLQRAKKDKAEGKAPSTQAGEFVKEEIDHIREGKQGARSPQQAIAIGLSKARRAGVELAPPRKGSTSEDTRQRASRDLKKGHRGKAVKPGANRSKAAPLSPSTPRRRRDDGRGNGAGGVGRDVPWFARSEERRVRLRLSVCARMSDKDCSRIAHSSCLPRYLLGRLSTWRGAPMRLAPG